MTETMILERRAFGGTDMSISPVGLGAWAIGGSGWAFGWGRQDDDEAVAAVRHAVDLGINWVDTAAAYGLGHSEEVVGRAIRGLPSGDRPLVFTKGGMVWDPTDRSAPPELLARPDTLRREVEGSLNRLGVERIDLYQVHWPSSDGTSVEEYWQTMLDLRAEGKVRAVGLCNHGVDLLERAERVGHVDTAQPPLSLIDRSATEDVLPWCREHGTGVIVYSPMYCGLLTGSIDGRRVLAADDWRSQHPDFTGEGLRKNLAFVDAMRPVAAAHGTSLAAVAVAWVLTCPGVTGAIVGGRRPEQIDGWIDGARIALTDHDIDVLAGALERTEVGSGPVPRRGATNS